MRIMARFGAGKSRCAAPRIYFVVLFGASLMLDGASALEILTNKTVSLWLGERHQSIPCDVRLDPSERIAGFSWHRDSMAQLTVKLFRDEVSGPGIESGEYSLSADKALVINGPVTIEDEGQYFCRVVLSGATSEHFNSSTIRVLSAPNEPFPTIPECDNSSEYTLEGGCLLTEEAGTRMNITCELTGFRPLINLTWTNGTREIHDVYRTLTNNTDGTQNARVMFEVTASVERQEFVCAATGEALGDSLIRRVVTVEGSEVTGSPLVVIIIIVIAIIIVVVVLLIAIVVFFKSRTRQRRQPSQKTSDSQFAELEKGSSGLTNENVLNQYTVIEEVPVVEEPAEELRLNEATQTDIPPPSEDDRGSEASDVREQSQELLREDDSQSISRGPSQLSSRSDIAHHDFGESWVCVSPEELKNLQVRTADEDEEVQPPAGTQRPQREGPFSGMLIGLGRLMETVNTFIRHDA